MTVSTFLVGRAVHIRAGFEQNGMFGDTVRVIRPGDPPVLGLSYATWRQRAPGPVELPDQPERAP